VVQRIKHIANTAIAACPSWDSPAGGGETRINTVTAMAMIKNGVFILGILHSTAELDGAY